MYDARYVNLRQIHLHFRKCPLTVIGCREQQKPAQSSARTEQTIVEIKRVEIERAANIDLIVVFMIRSCLNMCLATIVF